MRPAKTTAVHGNAFPASTSLKPEDFVIPARDQFGYLTPGYVYVIQWGDDGPVKIGQATSPDLRLADLQCGNWMSLRLVAVVPAANRMSELESQAHAIAKGHRIRGEWFDLHPLDAVEAIMAAALKLGIPLQTKADAVKAMRAESRAATHADYEREEEERRAALRRRLGME